jgi:aminoglycoside phosphotransferase (APT) family kinase protein
MAKRSGATAVLDDDILAALQRCREVESPTGGSARGSAGPTVGEVRRLSGGASRLTWLAQLLRSDGATTPVIVQQERPGSVGASLPMSAQVSLLEAAAVEAVPVAEVLASGGESGRGWVVLEHLPGESLARRILEDASYDGVRPLLAREAGRILAAVHRIPADAAELPSGDQLEQMRMLSELLDEPHPAFELGLRWLEEHRPHTGAEVVVHGDFRMGNLLVDPDGVTAVLDWELSHLGSGAEDLGWFCSRAWRFGSPLRAGGVGTLEELLAGYAEGGGVPPTPEEVDWWEAYGTLRWGLICVLQASTHLRGLHRSVELAAIGRRAAECEEDLLAIIDGPSDEEPPALPEPVPGRGPHDRPTSPELLEAVAEHLTELRGQLEGSGAFHLRVATNVVDLVSREIRLGPLLESRHHDRLRALGVDGDRELVEAIRADELPVDHAELHRLVRQSVRDKLAVARPGYWYPDDAAT